MELELSFNPNSDKDHRPFVITSRRNELPIFFVKLSATILAPSTHLTCPRVVRKISKVSLQDRHVDGRPLVFYVSCGVAALLNCVVEGLAIRHCYTRKLADLLFPVAQV